MVIFSVGGSGQTAIGDRLAGYFWLNTITYCCRLVK